MSVEPGAGEVELRASPTRHLLFALLFGGFAVVGLIAAFSQPAAWFGVAFFGLIAAGLVLSALPSASGLVLSPSGFTVRLMFRGTRTAWDDVVAVGVGRQPGRGATVTVTRRTDPTGRTLPDNYGMDADELAALLERWRAANAGR